MLAEVRKAVTSFVGTALTGIGVASADGDLTRKEVIIALGAAAVAAGLVWRIPNSTPGGN